MNVRNKIFKADYRFLVLEISIDLHLRLKITQHIKLIFNLEIY